MRRAGIWLILLSLTLSLAVPLAYGGIDGLSALRDLPAADFALLLGMAMLGWLCNAARLHLLARNLRVYLGAKTVVSTIIACEFAAVATPLGSGSLPMHILLLSRQGISAGRTLGIMAMDRIMDLIFFATALPLALAIYVFHSGQTDFLHWGVTAIILLTVGLAIVYVSIRHHRPVVNAIGYGLWRIPLFKKKRLRIVRWFVHFNNSMRMLFTMGPASLALLYALCVGHWLIRYSILPLLLWFTGHPTPWSYLFVAQGLALFSGQLSMLPGGGGGVELALGLLLSPYLNLAATAAALLEWRFITFHWSLLIGTPVFLFLMGRRPGSHKAGSNAQTLDTDAQPSMDQLA